MEALLEQRIQYLERLLSTKTRSPIVAQLASLYLEAGRPHDALRYCDSAIAHFPYYTTAHLIRAKVLTALEMHADARREFDFVHSILPDVESVKALRDSIPASETETFEEVAQTMDASAPVVDQVPEDLESPASSAEETEMHVAEEGILDDGVSDSFGQPLLVEPDDGGEAPAQADTELGETEEKLSENAADEDAFGLGRIGERAPSPEAATTLDEDTPAASVEAMSDESNSFGDPGPAAVESGALASSENVGGTGEGYEEFAEAMRRELSGSENTVSLEEFLAPADQSTAEYDADDGIEELAEKLKTPPKITPVIDITEKKAPPPSEEDTPASTGFVTPTLAEIYAKQGWYDDAIVAYKTLARIKPAERERFEKRIQELEELKKSEEGGA